MSEVFLVALSNPESALGLLTAAASTARAIDQARIDVLAVRMPPEAMFLSTEEVMTEEFVAKVRDAESARIANLRDAYVRWVAQAAAHGRNSEWIEVEGLPSTEVAARARSADLVIVERAPAVLDGPVRQTIHAALFDSHRPVMVVPSHLAPTVGRRLAIAWKDDGRAMKAIIPAIRYFAGAEDISVLIGYRDGAPPKFPAGLTERGVVAKAYPLLIGSEPFGQLLLAKVTELGADLLVMGAYAHSQLRERLLGGVTEYVLAHAEIPVLMRH